MITQHPVKTLQTHLLLNRFHVQHEIIFVDNSDPLLPTRLVMAHAGP